MASFTRVYPAVVVHDVSAELTRSFTIDARVPKVSHNGAFARFGWSFPRVLKWPHYVILRMVSVFVPLGCFDDYWFLSVLCHNQR